MSAPTSSAPLVVNTRDGACWTRRTVTEGGIALYALADVCKCPEFVMATLAELAERGIVGSADVLPVPVGSEPQRLTAGERAKIAELIGDSKPATSALLVSFGEAVRDRREHEHPKWEDFFCLNLSSYMGERTGPVLRRLVDVEAENERLRSDAAALRAERHSTNESLDEAVQQLRVDRDRIAQLEALAAAATEYRVWEPGYGLYVRRSPGATGFAILESRRTDQGRRAWTKAGLRYTVALSEAELFCWPDAGSAVAEARRVLPGAVVREGEPAETGGA